MDDTDLPTRRRYLDGIRKLSGAERLARAVALSAVVREFAWQGAQQHAGPGPDATLRRFLSQLYGSEFAGRALALLGAEERDG